MMGPTHVGVHKTPATSLLSPPTPTTTPQQHNNQALRRLVQGLEAEAAALVEERADWDRIWLGRPGLLEAMEELLEGGDGADVEVRACV